MCAALLSRTLTISRSTKMRLLIIVSYFLTALAQGHNGVFWPCSTPKDCEIAKDAFCSEFGICVCPKQFTFSEDLKRCIEIVTYGGECEETAQCVQKSPGTKCRSTICQCEEGYQFLNGMCRKFSNLNDPCGADSDCYFGYDRESVVCSNRLCKCASGFYERYTNICRRISKNTEECIVNADCSEENALCADFVCLSTNQHSRILQSRNIKMDYATMDTHAVLNAVAEMQPRVGSRCTNYKEECIDLPHSICADGKCSCKLGYYELDSQCFAELGEKSTHFNLCMYDYQPDTELCLCPKNYLYEPGLQECKKPVTFSEGRCVSDSQCSPFGASYCRQERPRICECRNFATFNETLQLCQASEGLGAFCEDSSFCRLPNSVCSLNKICICKESFLQLNEKCVPGLGAECQFSEECADENAVCDNNLQTCACEKGFVGFNNSCLQEATSVGAACKEDIQCRSFMGSLAKCINNQCECDSASHLNNNTCFSKTSIGSFCQTTSECYSDQYKSRIECRNSICQCLFGFTADESKRICIDSRGNAAHRLASNILVTLLAMSAFTSVIFSHFHT